VLNNSFWLFCILRCFQGFKYVKVAMLFDSLSFTFLWAIRRARKEIYVLKEWSFQKKLLM
jgi:hypothetical protein